MEDSKFPAFPLNILLLPKEKIHLHLFEPRYKQLLKDINYLGGEFVIPVLKQNKINQLGSLVRVTEILETYPDGRVNLEIECIKNFKISNYFESSEEDKYDTCKVEFIGFSSKTLKFDTVEIYWKYLQLISNKVEELFKLKDISLNEIALNLNLSTTEKIKFLNLNFSYQVKFIENKILFLTLLYNQETKTENNFYLN